MVSETHGFVRVGSVCGDIEANFEFVIYLRSIPVNIGRKLNVHKTFRTRPGRLLNVLCAFNLRLASTGIRDIRYFRSSP